MFFIICITLIILLIPLFSNTLFSRSLLSRPFPIWSLVITLSTDLFRLAPLYQFSLCTSKIRIQLNFLLIDAPPRVLRAFNTYICINRGGAQLFFHFCFLHSPQAFWRLSLDFLTFLLLICNQVIVLIFFQSLLPSLPENEQHRWSESCKPAFHSCFLVFRWQWWGQTEWET